MVCGTRWIRVRTSRDAEYARDGAGGGATVAEKRVDFEYNKLDQITKIARYKAIAGGAGNEVATSTFHYDALARLDDLDITKGAANIANYAWTFDDVVCAPTHCVVGAVFSSC